MLRTRGQGQGQVRVLGPADRDRFIALAEQDPVLNVFVDYRARLTNLDERWLGGQVWGRFAGDDLVAGCHLGANLVPVQCTPDDVTARMGETFAVRVLDALDSTNVAVRIHDGVHLIADKSLTDCRRQAPAGTAESRAKWSILQVHFYS